MNTYFHSLFFAQKPRNIKKRAWAFSFQIFHVTERLIYRTTHFRAYRCAILTYMDFKLYFWYIQVVGPDPGAVAAAAWFNQIALAFS
jgi:hypothetical protein